METVGRQGTEMVADFGQGAICSCSWVFFWVYFVQQDSFMDRLVDSGYFDSLLTSFISFSLPILFFSHPLFSFPSLFTFLHSGLRPKRRLLITSILTATEPLNADVIHAWVMAYTRIVNRRNGLQPVGQSTWTEIVTLKRMKWTFLPSDRLINLFKESLQVQWSVVMTKTGHGIAESREYLWMFRVLRRLMVK